MSDKRYTEVAYLSVESIRIVFVGFRCAVTWDNWQGLSHYPISEDVDDSGRLVDDGITKRWLV